MKILTAKQIQALDAYTIKHEPITSIDLMERAARVFTDWFTKVFPNTEEKVIVFCGPGNNGGDGLAIARLLHGLFYNVEVMICEIEKSKSADFEANQKKLTVLKAVNIASLKEKDQFPTITSETIIVDAIFGSGLSRPIDGYWKELIQQLNSLPNRRVAVDIPSGVFADRSNVDCQFNADYTLSFELPKRAFMYPENEKAIGDWSVQSIDLAPAFLDRVETAFYYIDQKLAAQSFKQRNKFAHKGTFGHSLIMAGSMGKIGAAVLATKACLRSGSGLVSAHVPKCGYEIMQSTVPEAMVVIDPHEKILTELIDLSPYQAIGIGCGIGTETMTAETLEFMLKRIKIPLVLDADALNIIAKQQKMLKHIPKESILTPHVKEFERLFGESENDFERTQLQMKMALELGVYIILKGAHTTIATPEAKCYFNSTGNPGMATGGSGDVLTGLLTGLLAQGYFSEDAAIFGVYLHGLAGDLAVADVGEMALTAGDLLDYFGKGFLVFSA